MKKILIIILVLFSFGLYSQGTKFFEGSWAEVLELANKEDKLIFVDVSTPRCRPCIKMKKETLPQKKVGTFLNKHFINLSINAHDLKGLELNLFYVFSSYPSFLYIDKKGNLIYKFYGFKNADQLIEASKFAINRYDDLDEFQGKIEEGKNNYAFIIKYIKTLNRLDMPSENLAINFLKSNQLREGLRLTFIYRTISTTQGELFKDYIENIDKLRLLLKPKEVDDKVYLMYKKDLAYYTQKDDKKKIKKILNSIKNIDFLRFDEFDTYGKLLKAESTKKPKRYDEFAREYFNLLESDSRKRDFIKTVYLKEIENKSFKNLSLDLARYLFENSKTPYNQILYTRLLVITENFDEAEIQIKLAMNSVNENNDSKLRKKLRNYFNYVKRMKTSK